MDLLGVGIIAPMSPYLVARFNASAFAVAMLTLSYSAAQLLATPVLGVLSDKLGRRPVLLFSILGSAAGYVLFALAGSLHILLLARIIDGATGGNISTAQAAMADVTPKKDRARAYGLIGAAFGFGFLLGPVFSALLVHIAPLAPIWAAAGLSLCTAGLVYFRLPETHPPERRRIEPVSVRDLNPFAAILRAWLLPGVGVLLSAIFAFGLAHAEFRAVFGKLMLDRFGLSEEQAGWLFAFMGFIAILVQGGLVRRVAPWLGDKRTILIGLPIGIVGYACIPLAPEVWAVYGSIALCGLGMGLAGPPLTGILSRTAPPGLEGTAMGASQSASSLGLVVGPIIAGALYDSVGMGWPFWTAAGFIGIGLLIVTLGVKGRKRPPGEPEVAVAAEVI